MNALVGHVDDDLGGRETVKCGDTLVKNAHKKKKKTKAGRKVPRRERDDSYNAIRANCY